MKLSMQIGQFIGTRADFVPEPICKKLSLLQDKVPLPLLHNFRGIVGHLQA